MSALDDLTGENVDQSGEDELEALAHEGLNSGALVECSSGYWEEERRRLNERLKE